MRMSGWRWERKGKEEEGVRDGSDGDRRGRRGGVTDGWEECNKLGMEKKQEGRCDKVETDNILDPVSIYILTRHTDAQTQNHDARYTHVHHKTSLLVLVP